VPVNQELLGGLAVPRTWPVIPRRPALWRLLSQMLIFLVIRTFSLW